MIASDGRRVESGDIVRIRDESVDFVGLAMKVIGSPETKPDPRVTIIMKHNERRPDETHYLQEQEQRRDSLCNKQLREAGKAYPRTCRVCGLGPCREDQTKNAMRYGVDQ